MMRRLSVAALGFIAMTGCSEELIEQNAHVHTHEHHLTVPGPWAPPASTLAIARTQYVPVVNPPSVSPAGSCSSSNAFACSCRHPACAQAHTGTRQLDSYLRQRWPFLGAGGLFCCRQNSARTSVPKLSVHAIGRAIDLMVPLENGDADNGRGDQVANWLVENAEFIGIQRVIWDKKYWNGERGFGNLSSSSLSHTNHIHVELSIDGAYARTPFFTSGAVNGTCTPKCQGTLLVREDCSTFDCASQRSQCLPGPPAKCSDPPPPEPPKTRRVSAHAFPSVRTQGGKNRLTFVPPLRLFDTRKTSPNVKRAGGQTSGPLKTGGPNEWKIASSGLPSDIKGVWINTAAVQPAGYGFMTIVPSGGAKVSTSMLNYAPMAVRANQTPVLVGSSRGVDFYTDPEDTNAVVDLYGILTETGNGMTNFGPTRVLDTRSVNALLVKDQVREIDVRVPTGATGVVATMVAVRPEDNGFIKAWGCGLPEPDTSNINFGKDTVIANTVISPLGVNGKLCVKSIVDTDLVVDVSGYFTDDGELSYQAIRPVRLFDTRQDTSPLQFRMAEKQIIELPIQQFNGMPDAVWSVVANIAVLQADKPGFVTVYPCGGIPKTSTVNFAATPGAYSALSVAPVNADGKLCVFASSRVHIIFDLLGVWLHDKSYKPPMPPMTNDPDDEGDQVDPDDPKISMDMGMSTTDMGSTDMGSSDMPSTDMNNNGSDMPGTGGSDMADNNGERGNKIRVKNEDGCQVARAPSNGPGAPVWLVGLLMFVGWIRRK